MNKYKNNAHPALPGASVRRSSTKLSSLLRRILRAEQLEDRLTLDGSDPITAILQPPDSHSHIAISFNRSVVGVDLGDFVLQQGDEPLDLSSAQLESLSDQDYVLTLPELFSDGDYELRLLAENSGIADAADPLTLLLENAMVEWTRDTLAPTLDFNWTLPTIVEPTEIRIAALGDSQTTEEGNSYVPYLRQTLSSTEYSVEIFAEPGWRVQQVQGLWDSSVKDAGYDVAVFFAGVNDLNSTDRSATEIFTSLATMFNEALARNMKVVAVGVSPWSHFESSNSFKQARTVELNGLLAQYAADHTSQVRFVDARSVLGAILDPQRLSTRYDSGDGLHLSTAGDKRLANAITQAISQFRTASSQSSSVTVSVSEAVADFSEANFQLLRDGSPYAYTATTLSPQALRFEFAVPENDTASYSLQWIGSQPIADLFGNALSGADTSTTLIDRQAPSAQLSLTQPAVSHQTIDSINIQFSEPVTGLTVDDFQLLFGQTPLDLSGVTLTELAPDSYQLNLASLASASGSYRLILASGDAEVEDSESNLLSQPAIIEWVHLDSEPTLIDGVLTIGATRQSETLEMNIASDHVDVWINGLNMSFGLENVQQIKLNTRGGADIVSVELLDVPQDPQPTARPSVELITSGSYDSLTLYGIAGDDIFRSTPTGVIMSNALITMQAAGFFNVHAYGASTSAAVGNDTATFIDSTATERFTGRPDRSQWTAPTYEHWAVDFSNVEARSSGGGDTATLYDSTGDDVYTADRMQGLLAGVGYRLQVNTFPVVTVNSSLGFDSASLNGSPAVDTYVAQSQSTAFYGNGYRHNLNRFEATTAKGNGGSDIATFYDSPGTDTAELSPFNGRMTGSGFNNVAIQFPRINAFSRAGADTITLTGSAGIDTFTGQEASSALVGNGYGLYAYRFFSTIAIGNGGADTAKLYDSNGDDRFDATPASSTLTTATFALTAQQFPTVYAYGRNGTDLAFLSGSSAAETYTGYATYGAFSSAGRTQFAYGFDRVTASGGGGADVANLYDSNDNDTLVSSLGQSQWSGPGFQHVALGFPRTNTYARAGYDTAELNGSTGSDQFNGQVTVSYVTGGGLTNYAYGFDRVSSNGLGGNDTANIYDSTGDDALVATSQWSSLQSGAFSNTVSGYARTNVYARTGFDTATLVGTAGVETFSGQTTGSSMTGTGFANYVYAFDAVVAESAGGADIANLYDSNGDDLFIASATSATLSGTGYRYTANAFSRVNAYGRAGNDTAMLIGSSRSESVVARPDYSYIKTTTYLNYASGFDSVSISGGGGNDTAFLYDSVGNDQFTLGNRSATLMGSGFTVSLDGFFRINAYASSGYDRVTLNDSTGNDSYTGRNNLGTLSNSSFTANLDSFDSVALAPAIGGTNTLDIANLTYVLEVGIGWR